MVPTRPEGQPAMVRYALLCLAALFAHLLVIYIDRSVAEMARHLGPGVLDLFRALTELGDSKWYLIPTGIAALALLLAARWNSDRRRARILAWLGWAIMFVFAAVALSGILANVMKAIIGRGRPKLLDQEGFVGLVPFTLNADYHSFPSGHSNTVFALALALAFMIPRARAALLAVAAVIASSRVAVNAHFVTDIVGGAALAVVTTYWLRAWFANRGLVFARDGYQVRRAGRAMPALAWRAVGLGPKKAAPSIGADGAVKSLHGGTAPQMR